MRCIRSSAGISAAQQPAGCTRPASASKRWERKTTSTPPAYTAAEIDALRTLCSHIIFNSDQTIRDLFTRVSGVSAGLRINPQHSTQSGAIYDPCAPYSRLGITRAHFPTLPAGVEGFHMHTLCEQDADALVETFEVLERDFGRYFRALKWLNLGGGHHITRPGTTSTRWKGLIG